MPGEQPLEPEATVSVVRGVGAFFILLGGIQIYFGDGWYVDGVPERWLGVFVLAFGALMEINPDLFRRRVGRLCQKADQILKRSSSNPY
jgi:hypothetical protein